MLKSGNLCNKIQFTEFLLLFVVQIFKIVTIVETLVTVAAASMVLYISLGNGKEGGKGWE